MKLLTRILALLLTVVLGGAVLPAVQPALAATPTFYSLDNDKIRFGTGSEDSITSEGLLKQPFYKSGASWYKLTYSSYSLDLAIGLGGSGTGTWNTNGTIFGTFTGYGISSLTTDYSGFVKTADVGTGAKGYGVVVSTADVTKTFNSVSYTIRVQNTYELGQTSSFVKITTKITNVGASTVSNLRTWVGTRDDWVGQSDSTTKTRGTIDVTNGFVAGTSNAGRNPALKISSGAEAVIFYSPHASANTSINSCCSFANAYNTNPSTSQLALTNDGSYAMFVPLADLTTNSSDEFTWYYAAGSTAEIASVVEQVAQAAASWNDQTITSTVLAGAAYSDAVSAGGTGTITYSVASGYSLPAGLSLNSSTGAITGNPTTTGSYTFRISATSVSGNTSSTVTTADLSLTVGQIPTLSSSTLTSSIVLSTVVSQSVTASAYPAPTYTVSSGSLPTGLSLNSSTGAITGTPSATGDFTFTISASNSFGSSSLITQSTSVVAAPAFTDSTINARATKGVAYSSEVAASGWPAPTYSVSSGSLPDGLTLNATTGAISGSATSSGDYSFSISATNSQGAVTTSSLSIQVGSAASVAFDQMPQFGYVGVSLEIAATTGGFPSPTYSVSSGSLPPGLTVNSSTGQITGSPTQAGTFTFAVSASNWVLAVSTANYQITIYAAPEIQNAASVSQTAALGSAISATLEADITADAWRIDQGSLPAGVTFDDATGTLSGTASESGQFEIMVSAQNSAGWGAPASISITITQAPSLEKPNDRMIQLGEPFSITLAAAGYPEPSFTVSVGALPTGLLLDSSTGTISGTPTEEGDFEFIVAATNSTGQSQAAITTFTVASVPIATDGSIDTDTELGSQYSSAIAFGGFPAAIMEVVDPSKLPDGISFDAATGVFAGTTTKSGSFTFEVLARNEYFTSELLQLTISVNKKPSLSSKSVSGDFLVGTSYVGSVLAAGYPSPTYAVASGTLPPGISLDSTSGSLTGSLTQTGEYKFVIEASNQLGTYRFTQSTISVGDTPPKLATKTIEVIEGTFFSDDLTVDIFPVPEYTIKSGALPAGVALSPSGFLQGTPSDFGRFEFTVEVANWAGTTESSTITLEILKSPTLTSQELDNQVNLAGLYQDSMTVAAYPQATYTLSSGSLPEGLSLNSSTGEIFGLPTEVGSFTFVIQAQNKLGVFTFEEKTIEVGEAPKRTSAITITTEIGLELQANLSNTSYPQPDYEISSGSLPAGISIATNGSLTGTAQEYGQFKFKILASSWVGSTESETITLEILKSPELLDGDISNRILLGADYLDSVSTTAYPSPTYELTSGELPPGVFLNSQDGSLAGTASEVGEYEFTIRAVNQAGYLDFASFQIHVGTKPEGKSDFPNFSALRTDSVDVDLSVDATPIPHYEISSGTLPPGLVFDTTTGRLSGTPSVLGTFEFKVTAISWAGTAESGLIRFDVESPPVLVAQDLSDHVAIGSDVDFGFNLEAFPAAEFTISDGYLPTGLELNAATGGISGTPSKPGKFTFSILAANRLASTDLGSFTVEVTEGPAWTNGDLPVDVEIGAQIDFEIPATGYPLPTFTIASGALPPGLVISESGHVSGVATTVGEYAFTIAASNQQGEVVRVHTIKVTQSPTISLAATGDTPLGTNLNLPIGVEGYPKPSLNLNGTLPSGLVLNSDLATLSGTVTSLGVFEFTISATNSSGTVTSAPITLSVVSPPIVKSQDIVNQIPIGSSVDMGFEVLAYPKPTYAVSNGQLPFGLALDATTGRIVGQATQSGTYSFTVIATNAKGETNLGSYDINVTEPPQITSFGLPKSVELGENISASIATGGYPAPTISVSSGTLPPGVTLTSDGKLYGTPNTVGVYDFEILVANSSGSTKRRTSITVNQRPAFNLSAIPVASKNKPFEYLVSSAGYPKPTLSIEGQLPAGLSFAADTGLITGVPTTSGSFEVVVRAENELGADTRSLNIVVRGLTVKPKITVQAKLGTPIAGAPVDVEVIGAKPGADYVIELHSDPIVLGQGKVPEDGQVVVNAQIPDVLEPGWHRIELRTTGQDESSILDTLYFEVTANGLLESTPQSDAPTDAELATSLVDDLAFIESMGLDPAALVPVEVMQEQAELVVTAVAALTLAASAASAAGLATASSTIPNPSRVPVAPMAPTGASGAVGSSTASRAGLKAPDNSPGGSGASGGGSGAGDDPNSEESELSYGAIEGDLDDFTDERTSWGDRLGIWKFKFMTAMDHVYFRLANALASVSPVAGKVVNDGSYLTAIFGVFSVVPTIAAVWFGIVSVNPDAGTIYGALNATAFTAVIALGTIDALAGFAGAIAVVITLVASYGVQDSGVGRYLLTIVMLGFGPVILATAFRKIRRNRISGFMDVWERLTDVAVIFFISFLSTISLLSAVSSLAANDVTIAKEAPQISLVVAMIAAIRILFEELAAAGFTARLEAINPSEVRSPSELQGWFSLAVKYLVLNYMLAPVVGTGWALWVGGLVIFAPSLVAQLGIEFPKSKILWQAIPAGLVSLAIATLLSNWSGAAVAWLFEGASNFKDLAYVLTPIPAICVAFASMFAEPSTRVHDRIPGRNFVFMLGGIAIFAWTLEVAGFWSAIAPVFGK